MASTLTRIDSISLSADWSRKGPEVDSPALLTSSSTSPNACAHATTVSTPSGVARSAASVSITSPFVLTRAASRDKRSAPRPTASTGWPRSVSALVNSAPMPPDAPVTIAQPLLMARASPFCENCNEDEPLGRNRDIEGAVPERVRLRRGQRGSGTELGDLSLRRIARRPHLLVRLVHIAVLIVE